MSEKETLGAEEKVISIVDDDDAVRDSLKILLELQKFRIVTFETCQSFLVSPWLPRTRCLILDIHLPGMNGFELLEVLQSMNVRIPSVLVTGRSDKSIRERASMLGALALLEKPIDFDRLMAALAAMPSHT